jgi:hypothetical protein
MQRNFLKASLISIAACAAAVLMGFWSDFRYTAFAIAGLQVPWTLFCILRVFQLRHGGGHRPDAPVYDRDSYGFALGGSVCSSALLLLIVVLTQVV